MINVEYLIQGREKYKCNKSQFARELGLTIMYYRNIENGLNDPKAETIRKCV